MGIGAGGEANLGFEFGSEVGGGEEYGFGGCLEYW